MTERIHATVRHNFQISSERAYDAWLDPDLVRQWMSAALQTGGLPGEMLRCEIDPRVGGTFFFSDRRSDIEAKHWGTYLELDRPSRIVFTWIVDPADEANPSRVTIDLTPTCPGCAAALSHEMDAKWSDYVSRVETGWGRMLAAIADLLPRCD